MGACGPGSEGQKQQPVGSVSKVVNPTTFGGTACPAIGLQVLRRMLAFYHSFGGWSRGNAIKTFVLREKLTQFE